LLDHGHQLLAGKPPQAHQQGPHPVFHGNLVGVAADDFALVEKDLHEFLAA